MTAELESMRLTSKLLAGTRADLQVGVYRDGNLANPTGTLTCSVVGSDGTVLATPSVSAAGGVLTAVLTAAQLANVDRLTVTWGGLVFDAEPAVSLVEEYEVVGAFLFTLDQARRFENGALRSESAYSNAELIASRERITSDFEDILGFPLGRQLFHEVLDGSGYTRQFVSQRELLSVRAIATRSSSTWTAYSASELAAVVPGSMCWVNEGQYWPAGNRNVRITYEAGMEPFPPTLSRAALIVLKDRSLPNNLSRKAIQQVDELGTFRLATPGERGSHFGIPEVDELLNRLSKLTPGFA